MAEIRMTEVERVWIIALRSGKYHQQRHSFYHKSIDGREYACAVGVLRLAVPGEAVWNLLTEKATDKVMELNDRDGKTFEEIAAWLEANARKRQKGKGMVIARRGAKVV